MEDWQKELMEWMETVTVGVEGFFDEVGQIVEDVAEEFHNDIVRDVDQFLQDVFMPILDISLEEEIDISYRMGEDSEFMISPKIDPTANVHPACQGCHHYHGRVYGKNILVCGMHPYGWNDLHCPDWEEDNRN